MSLWRRLSPLPGGARLFAWFLARTVPYSGSFGPRVEALEPGHVRIGMRDRRRVRNHLRSIHAIALANLAELASGLAVTTSLPDGVRGIVVRFRIDYFKKARGRIVAESRLTLPDVSRPGDHDVVADVSDRDGNLLARATVTWRLGPSAASR